MASRCILLTACAPRLCAHLASLRIAAAHQYGEGHGQQCRAKMWTQIELDVNEQFRFYRAASA